MGTQFYPQKSIEFFFTILQRKKHQNHRKNVSQVRKGQTHGN